MAGEAGGGGTGGSPADSPAGKDKPSSGEDDVRTLSVEWDEHGERFKPRRTACRKRCRATSSATGANSSSRLPPACWRSSRTLSASVGIAFAGGTT